MAVAYHLGLEGYNWSSSSCEEAFFVLFFFVRNSDFEFPVLWVVLRGIGSLRRVQGTKE